MYYIFYTISYVLLQYKITWTFYIYVLLFVLFSLDRTESKHQKYRMGFIADDSPLYLQVYYNYL